jgi:hypothetical protein
MSALPSAITAKAVVMALYDPDKLKITGYLQVITQLIVEAGTDLI